MSCAVRICIVAFMCVFPAVLAAQVSTSRMTRVQFLGREYVRLTDWAKANNFTIRVAAGGKMLQITNRYHNMQFEVDSREARINGVKIWLLSPVAARNGVGYISSLDLRSTIQPVLYPQKVSGMKIRTIALDPGHGGKDTGNHHNGYQEKKYTLLLAQELRDQLTRAGFKVILTRSNDVTLELSDRAAIAKRRGADLFLSLHFNATSGNKSVARGIETYSFTPAGAPSTNSRGVGAESRASRGNAHDSRNMLLAFEVQRALVRALGAEDRGVRRARFQVLRDADMPAALIEAGFLSHPTEGRKLVDLTYRRSIAKAIVQAVQTYQRSVEQPASK